jgi:hypothetical protein
MNNIYKNPTNAEQIKEEILNLKTIGEIKQFYVNMFPTFIICSIKKYSEDYPFLQNNWDKFCKENNVTPTEILIVDNFDFIQENSLVLLFCEIMSKVGFCVRKKMDIIPCQVCGYALPSRTSWKLLFDSGKTMLPFSNKCKKCI